MIRQLMPDTHDRDELLKRLNAAASLLSGELRAAVAVVEWLANHRNGFKSFYASAYPVHGNPTYPILTAAGLICSAAVLEPSAKPREVN